jgi:ribonuclease Y
MLVEVAVVVGLVLLTVAVVLLALRLLGSSRVGAARRMRELLLTEAEREVETIRREAQIEAREESIRLRAEVERELAERRTRVAKIEERVLAAEEQVERKLTEVARREQGLSDRETHLRSLQQELKDTKEEEIKELERISGLTAGEARAHLLERSEELVRHDLARRVRQLEEEAQAEAKRRARNLVADALQRVAASHASETTSSLVELPTDDMKGRIIGREGRNIRAFEAATGVTVLVDDTPNAVVLSGFDPVRREIAREAMQRLILDGRIHPTRIEEVVAKVSSEMEESVLRAGEDAIVRAGVAPMHHDLVKLLGQLKFRMSYSQNVLDHSVEVAHLMSLMAGELGVDIETAKRAGLLHDVGKAVTHEIEGPHAIVGADIAKRCGESPAVVNGIASHHSEVPHEGVWGVLVAAADAISASRPGARSETLTTYIKRVEDLERIGMSFEGVEKVYAVQAGRELRVLVMPDEVDDTRALKLATEIARRIESELQYPGQIRVTVVRETRCTEVAK